MHVRRGITRTVLLIGPWAVKIPSHRSHGRGPAGVAWSLSRGVAANLSEAEWSGVDGVCPVRWSLAGLVNIYPRCEPVTTFDGDYDAVGPDWLPSGDRKPENLGLLNGKVVWLDYDFSTACQHAAR